VSVLAAVRHISRSARRRRRLERCTVALVADGRADAETVGALRAILGGERSAFAGARSRPTVFRLAAGARRNRDRGRGVRARMLAAAAAIADASS